MKEGYKQTELGVIPEDWEIKKLRDCSLIPGKYGINAPAVEFSNDLPTYLRITDIDDDGNFISFNKVSVNDMESNNFLLENEDLVFARTGATVGKSYLHNSKLNGNLVYAGFLIMFRLNREVLLPYYLRLLTQTEKYWNWVKTISMRSGQPGINSNEYCSLEIPVPPIEEQNAIANCLSTWDEAIEKQQKLIDAKEIRHKALMQKLLSGKKRLPGFTDEWKEVKLGDLFSERNETKYDDLPLLSIGQEGVYPQTESNKRDISNGDKSKYKRIVPSDIGYNTMRMWQGRSALSSLEGIVSPAYTILTPKENVDSYFFSLLFKTTRLTNLFWRNSQGLVDDTLNCKYKDFSIIKCNVPSYEEQNAITEILKISEAEIEIEKQKVDQLKEQKKALMQKLLTGKVRLPLNN